jgi:hypothetical protein
MNVGDNMNKDTKQIRQWIQDNLVMQQEAVKITGQSISGFNNSLAAGWLKPFVEFGEKRKIRLYLRSDMEAYSNKKR